MANSITSANMAATKVILVLIVQYGTATALGIITAADTE